MQGSQEPEVWRTSIDSSGRVSIPTQARRAKGWEAGTKLIFRKTDSGRMEVLTLEDFVREVQDFFSGLDDPDVLWSDELIETRRREAEIEEGRA